MKEKDPEASDLGERLSKAMNRLETSPTRDHEVAFKIFLSVDRKAAEPKTKPKAGKGAPRSKYLFRDDLVLTPEERLLLESPHEILLVHSPDGRLQKAIQGNKGTVVIPSGLQDGSLLSHNHPGGNGASALDLNFVLSNPGMTLRIVAKGETGNELYRLKSTRPLPPGEIASIIAEYETASDQGGDTRQARLEALALILESCGDSLTAELATVK